MADPTVTFRFPLSEAVSWTLVLAAPAALIGGLCVYFTKPDLDVPEFIAGLLILVAVLGCLSVAGLRAFPFTLSADGIRGWAPRTIRGVTVPWSAIRGVQQAFYADIPCVLVQGENAENSCLVPTVLARSPQFKTTVQRFTSPTHCLVKALETVT